MYIFLVYVLVDALKAASFPLLLMRGTRWEYGQGGAFTAANPR